jgi:hypothetical protein
VSFINSRLRKLEERIAGGASGARCPECGDNPPSPEFIVVWPPEDDWPPKDERRTPEGPEFCPECGRQRWILGRVVYEGDEAKPGGGVIPIG